MLPPSLLVFLSKGGPISLQLRASNEALQRARVARAKETNGPPLSSYTGRGARTGGLVRDRTRLFFSFPHSSLPVCLTLHKARAGRLSERDQSVVGLPLLLSCNGCRRQWRRMFEATHSRSAGMASFRRQVEAKPRAVNGALWLRAERASRPWPTPLTPATSPRATPSPRTSTHIVNWPQTLLPSAAFPPCPPSWPTDPLSPSSSAAPRQTPVKRRA